MPLAMRKPTTNASSCLFFLLVAGSLCGCSDWKYAEIKRVTSPDSTFDAVLAGGSAGATTSQMYTAFVVRRGGTLPDPDRSVFAADHVDGLDIRWKGPKLLEINYREARIHQFRNHVVPDASTSPFYVVEINLTHAGEASALPPEDR